MTVQPIEVWGDSILPNPVKLFMILEALKVPYTLHQVPISETKSDASLLNINPNGRLPAIKDPNTDVALWETGAIILYLVDQYDKDGIISYQSSPKKYHAEQWLAFQISGQGPYLGQAWWFTYIAPDKISYAIDRYVTETIRIAGVLDTALKKNSTGWLVGDKCTYADISFVTWAFFGEKLLKDNDKVDELNKFPNYVAWLEALHRVQAVKKVHESMLSARAAAGRP